MEKDYEKLEKDLKKYETLIEINEQEYDKIAADKAEVESRTDITAEDKDLNLLGFDGALEVFEAKILEIGKSAKADIMSAIENLNKMVETNRRQIERHEQEIARRNAEIDEELAKEKPDEELINSKQVEIEGLEEDKKKLETAIRKIEKDIKEVKKKLVPLMKRFKDKGLFTDMEIQELEELNKKMLRAAKAAETRRRKKEEAEKPEPEVTEPEVTETEVAEPEVTETEVTETEVAEPEVTETESKDEIGTYESTEKRDSSRGGASVIVTTGEVPKKKDLKAEFDELYVKAKAGTLQQADYTRLAEITGDPENYDKLGITTGILRNKSKIVLKAMGKFATTNVRKAVNDSKEYFGLTTEELGNDIVSTATIMSWSGIKSIAGNSDVKLASQELFERVVRVAEEKGIENLDENEKVTYDKASKYLDNMNALRKTMDAYSEVKSRRIEERWGWLLSRREAPALEEAPAEKIEDIGLGEKLGDKVYGDADKDRAVSTEIKSKTDRERTGHDVI